MVRRGAGCLLILSHGPPIIARSSFLLSTPRALDIYRCQDNQAFLLQYDRHSHVLTMKGLLGLLYCISFARRRQYYPVSPGLPVASEDVIRSILLRACHKTPIEHE